MTYEIKIIPTDNGPAGKLADVEIHFAPNHVPLAGMKLVGFAVWKNRNGARNVTMPARTYSVNGERRSFALLRPAATTEGQDCLRAAILAAYDEHETAEPPIADCYNPNDAVSAARDAGRPDPIAEQLAAGYRPAPVRRRSDDADAPDTDF